VQNVTNAKAQMTRSQAKPSGTFSRILRPNFSPSLVYN